VFQRNGPHPRPLPQAGEGIGPADKIKIDLPIADCLIPVFLLREAMMFQEHLGIASGEENQFHFRN